MNHKTYKRHNFLVVFVLSLVFASLAIALPTFAESNPLSSLVKAVFSMEAKSEKTIDENKIETDSGEAVQTTLVAQQNCSVLDDFNRADSTNMGPNWTEVFGDIQILNNRAVASVNNSCLIYNNATPGDRACADVFAGTGTQFGGIYLKWTSANDHLFVKVQDNEGDGNFERVFFLRENGLGFNLPCNGGFLFSTPFSSARLYAYIDGSNFVLDVDTNFDGIIDETRSCGSVPAKSGTQTGLGFFGQTALDNFGIPPTTLTVTKTADTNDGVCDADCSLREAIAVAAPGDTIEFASPLFDTAQTINVNGQLVIDKSLTIDGRGANLTTVRNVAAAGGTSRVFLITTGTVNLSGLTISGGNLTAGVAVNGCGINTVCGGGIHNSGNLTLTNCAVSGNSVTGNLVLGAGIFSISATLTLINSTVSSNSASGNFTYGGGMHIQNNGANITNSTVSGNLASGQEGGGGISLAFGTLNIINSTVTNNQARGFGGGIANLAGVVNAVNTIISGNFASSSPDLFGSLSGSSTNNLSGGNARLLPLGNYGGATQTHALLPDSPAINAGSDCVLNSSCASANPPFALTTDQRGAVRFGTVDIGAFESPAPLIVNSTADPGDGVCNAANCTLREAINQANASLQYDLITFNIPATDTGCPNGVCTITLNAGQLTINNAATSGSLQISNPNGTAANLLISGNNASRVFNVVSGANLSLNNLTVTGGRLTGGNNLGGGIYNFQGTVTLTNCAVSNNVLSGGANNSGGGIYNANGIVTLTNSTVSNNVLSGGTNSSSYGGGIASDGGTVNITNSTFSNNSVTGTNVSDGGGIYALQAALNITGSTISNNSVLGGITNRGGGIGSTNDSTLNARNSIISGNTAVVGPDSAGAFNINDSNLIGNAEQVRLAPLGFYGGATMTHALLSGSTAINTGNNCVLNQSCANFNAPVALTADQRGANRVGAVDIGAFELNNSANGGNFKAVLPNGTQFFSYQTTLVPNNGAFAYTVTSGALPGGINLTTTFAPDAVVALSGIPTESGMFNFSITSDDKENSNTTDFTMEVFGATSAQVEVAGRVLTKEGRGIRNARILMTGQDGLIHHTMTNMFGYYRFTEVEVGSTYILTVESRQYIFAPQIISISENVSGLNFIAIAEIE